MQKTRNIAAKLLDAAPFPQILVGPEQRIWAMNTGAQRRFGSGMIGRHYTTVLRHPALLDCIETVLRDGVAGTARYVSRGSHGEVWDVTINPVDLAEGGAALITLEDTTATQEAGKIRRDFVANVSHELRTPLTAMLGFIETLRGAAKNDPIAQDRFLSIMEQEAGRMNRLVHDLLSLSRVEANERVRPRNVIDISAVIASVLSALAQIAADHNVTIRKVGLEAPSMLTGDADQLVQVFTNLIENAIKYGGKDNEIVISVAKIARDPVLRRAVLQVDVKDSGPGIDPLHVPRLTERFYRIDTHRSRGLGGTGLGLAIVKHIVNRHRGRLAIESAPGAGSTFTVVLPIVGNEARGDA